MYKVWPFIVVLGMFPLFIHIPKLDIFLAQALYFYLFMAVIKI